MSEWRRIEDLPYICERMIGFSVPKDDEVLVISYEGTHLLKLGTTVTIETDAQFIEYDIFNPDTGLALFRDKEYQIIGLHGGTPIVESPNGERLELDQKSETLSVVRNGAIAFSTKYKNFSGDWAAATFSLDGRYIVLGCPYDFDFVIMERVGVDRPK
jgi:hypothetical protein